MLTCRDSDQLDAKNLEQVLEIIFDMMKKEGMVTKEMENNKEAILEAVKEGLLANENKLSLGDVKDVNVQKKVMGAITLTAANGPDKLGKYSATPENNPFIKSLDKEDPDEKKTLDKSLEKVMKAILALNLRTNQFTQDGKKDIKTLINDFMKPFRDELEKSSKMENGKETDEATMEKQKQLKEIGKQLDEIEKQLSETLINMNGGDDPRIAGEVQKVIQGPIAGNLASWTNQSIADPNSKAQLTLDITYNAGGYDAQGKENSAKISGLLTGALEAVADVINETSFTKTPTNTPGTH